jgi:hypothetical protein
LAATFFFDAIDSFHFHVLGRSTQVELADVFKNICEHVLASSRVSQRAVVRKRLPLAVFAAAVADMFMVGTWPIKSTSQFASCPQVVEPDMTAEIG